MSVTYDKLKSLLNENSFQKKLDDFAEKYKDKKIIFYGAGTFFDVIADNYDLSKFNIIGIADMKFNDGKEYKGYKTFSSQTFVEQKPDVVFISMQENIIAEDYFKEEIFPKYGEIKYESLLEMVYNSQWNVILDRQNYLYKENPIDVKKILANTDLKITGSVAEQKLSEYYMYFKYLFEGELLISELEDNFLSADYLYAWGARNVQYMQEVINASINLNKPLLLLEQSFLSSIHTSAAKDTQKMEYCSYTGFICDDLAFYFDGTRQSRLEYNLNSDFNLTEDQKQRARKLIDKIISHKLTKYNHQPIFTPEIGQKGKKKVLVVDQRYGDYSIKKGGADDSTFKNMLECAIKENPDHDIIVKTHPDTMSGTKSGYYSDLKQVGNVYPITFEINPISLIEAVDKVYVVTTQFGFEALMCGKEVSVFGLPFYAGWGLTDDRQKFLRRTRKRSLEEIFYMAYVQQSIYINPETCQKCEIEDIIEYLLKYREIYFKEKNINS